MHIEFLVEDSSGKLFLESIIPRIIEDQNVTWRVHGYRGIGKIPSGLGSAGDPQKRIILDQLPRLLAGYGRTPYVDAVVIVVDSDTRNCREFLDDLIAMSKRVNGPPEVMFRLAIEEMEAWYFGDIAALEATYRQVDKAVLKSYVQDSVCGTWEKLADAITPGGSAKIEAQGWPAPGVIKAQWAVEIPPHMNVDANTSTSFCKLRDGVRRLVAANVN